MRNFSPAASSSSRFLNLGKAALCVLALAVATLHSDHPSENTLSSRPGNVHPLEMSADCSSLPSLHTNRLSDSLQRHLRSVQATGWGVEMLGSACAIGKRVWIIDSGVSLSHPDLTVDTRLSRCFVDGDTTRTAEDENGHGTMVAGIIAAKDNSFGVKGIADGATIVAVKVLNERAKGSYADIIAGLCYTLQHAQPGEVAVMCSSGPVWPELDEAVLALAEKGIRVVVTAGNHASFATEYSPARVKHPNLYVVAGIDSHFNLLPGSNFGTPPITHCAPGLEILTTSLQNSYACQSGSSMAAPHVAGLLLIQDGKLNTSPKAFCQYDLSTLYPVVRR